MSQENVEIVRQGFEAFERGELDAMLDLFTDDVTTYRADPDGATYDGKAGFLDATADWTEDFSEWRVFPRSLSIWATASWFGSGRWHKGKAAASGWRRTSGFSSRSPAPRSPSSASIADKRTPSKPPDFRSSDVAGERGDRPASPCGLDADNLDAFLAELDPELEWHPSIEPALEGRETVFRGHDGARRAWDEYRGEAWGGLKGQIQEIRDLGDSLLVLGHFDVTGRTTGIEFLGQEVGLLMAFRGGESPSLAGLPRAR